jgi:glycosyltransferase involved in cell wall biosynthesis
MTFTLALSARNASGLFKECFDSILLQTERPDRVLLILDDISKEPPGYLASSGVEIIKNDGVKLYHARNTALRACSTDILAFTDTDCVLDASWVKRIKEIFAFKPEVVAGTGSHPMIGRHNFSSWLHHMWFVMETKRTGYTSGVIGGNSYFRTAVLKKEGGWLPVSLMAAEDVYISMKLIEKGYKIWYDLGVIANHHYKAELSGFLRQAVLMGYDIVQMMKTARIANFMWYYTLCIPFVSALMILFISFSFFDPRLGLTAIGMLLTITLSYLCVSFRSLSKGFTRWIARWIIIWPYSWGIVKGLVRPIHR